MTESISSTGPAAHQHERERAAEWGARSGRGGDLSRSGQAGGDGRGGRDGMGDLPY